MAEATLRFLNDPPFQIETRYRAYEYARPMFWPNVGRQYLELFSRVAQADDATRLWSRPSRAEHFRRHGSVRPTHAKESH